MEVGIILGVLYIIASIILSINDSRKNKPKIVPPRQKEKIINYQLKWVPPEGFDKIYVAKSNDLNGTFLVNFIFYDQSLEGVPIWGNDPMRAVVVPDRGKLYVQWTNGMSALIDCEYLNIFEIEQKTV